MLTLEQIKQHLQDANLRKVAENSGVTYHKIYRLFHDVHTPRYDTVKKLSDYFEAKNG